MRNWSTLRKSAGTWEYRRSEYFFGASGESRQQRQLLRVMQPCALQRVPAKAEKTGNDNAHERMNQRTKAFKRTISEDARPDLRKIGKRMCKENVVSQCHVDERDLRNSADTDDD